ncbi:hypothetical protein AcW1_008717 [Taiwanofungus camphoratus]|nr:hypothetical protein AcW1_008717 [Antrodia cinnamomea]
MPQPPDACPCPPPVPDVPVPVPVSVPASSPSPGPPRTDHSSLPQELWLEIFRYATYVPRVRGLSPGDPFAPQRPANLAWGVNTPVSSMATKRTLVLVSRPWRALATELLYEHVVVSSRRRAVLLVKTLLSSDQQAASIVSPDGDTPRGHARWVRHLEIHTCSRTSKTAHFWHAVAAILSMLPNLHVLSGIWERPLPANLVRMFARYLGHSIRALYWEEADVPDGQLSLLAPAFLPRFHALRVLDIRRLHFAHPERVPPACAAAPAPTLPAVADLLVPTCPALLRFAAALALPRLRRLVLDAAALRPHDPAPVLAALAALLAAHGPRVHTLELLPLASLSYKPAPVPLATFLRPGVCPALHTLVFDCREDALAPPAPLPQPRRAVPAPEPAPAPAPDTVLAAPHTALRRVGLRGVGVARLYPSRPCHTQTHLHALLALRARALLPALETVRTLGLLVDASADPLARDIFIWWTERFEDAGLDLQDGEGVVWMYTDPEEAALPKEAQEVAPDDAVLVHKPDAAQLRHVPAPVNAQCGAGPQTTTKQTD